MRVFAFFLPQFHEVEENNIWWGEGFTEWTHVRAASALFPGHCQPIHPLHENYYNLLDQRTVEWQTDLLKKYKVDGLIYYHYYFKGDKLLEKPAENLLAGNIEQSFFFCWANHSWYKACGDHKTLLKEQLYGGKEDWERHFQYLLPFFLDSRYEKKDNKPLFMIFDSTFPEKDEIMDYFNKRCIENGFDGLYVIETWNLPQKKEAVEERSKIIFLREPNVSKNILDLQRPFYTKIIPWINYRIFKGKLLKNKKKKSPTIYDGNKLVEIGMGLDHKECAGVFFSWDNTPRHKENGYVITPIDQEHFTKYMDKNKKVDYLFINAWNEWAEGMILEPTEENGYKYLEWLKEWRKKNE